MTKKRLVVIIAIILIMLFAASCKNNSNNSGTSPVEASSQAISEEKYESVIGESAPEVEYNISEAAPISRGQTDGSTYINEYASITFTLPSGWIYYTDEELAELTGIPSNSYDVTDYTEEMLKNRNIFDMMAVNDSTDEFIAVMYDNLLVTGNSSMTVDDYLSYLVEENEYESEFTNDEIGTATICNETYSVLSMSSNTGEFVQRFYIRKLDNYIVGITVSSSNYKGIDKIIESFS